MDRSAHRPAHSEYFGPAGSATPCGYSPHVGAPPIAQSGAMLALRAEDVCAIVNTPFRCFPLGLPVEISKWNLILEGCEGLASLFQFAPFANRVRKMPPSRASRRSASGARNKKPPLPRWESEKVGCAGTIVNCRPAMATSEAFRGRPSRAHSLRYTIEIEVTTPAKECLFNTGHWRNEDAGAGRTEGNGSRRQGCCNGRGLKLTPLAARKKNSLG